MIWTITPLRLFAFSAPGPEVFFQRDFGRAVDMIIYAFLLTCDSEAVLVDCGLPEDFTALNGSILARKGAGACFKACAPSLVHQLAMRQIRPSCIILSSFGPYAAGGLTLFPSHEVIVSKRGWSNLATPEEIALNHPLPENVEAILHNAKTVSCSIEVRPGIRFVEAGVHHPASAAVLVHTSTGWVGIADPIFVRRNLTDGIALGAAEHAAGWHSMVREVGKSIEAIIPIHDPDPTPLPRDAWHPLLTPPPGSSHGK